MARDSPRVCASCVFWVWGSSHFSVKQDPSLLRYVLYSCFHLWPHIPSAMSRKFSWDLFFCGPLEGIAFCSAPNPNCSAVKSSWPIRPQKRSEVRNLEDLTDVTVRGWNYCRKWVHNTFFVPTAKSHALLPNHIPYISPIQIVIYCMMYILIVQYRHTDYCIDNLNKSSLY